MKKFLSVLLAVMMVLSTVSFAVPSAVGTMDGYTAPVAPEVYEEADLAEDFAGKYGEIVFSINFEDAAVGEIDLSKGVKITDLGATINPAYPNAADLKLTNLNGGYYTEIFDDATNYLFYTGVASTSGLIMISGNKGLTDKTGSYVLTFDLDYVQISGNASTPITTRFTAQHTLNPAVENSGTDSWSTVTNENNFREFVARSNDLSKVGSIANVDTFKLFGNNGAAADDEFYIDNITLYYVSDTATVTVAMGDKGEDVVISDYPTKGLTVKELAEKLPYVAGYTVTGFSATEGGAALDSLAVAGDTTFYPIWEEQYVYGELLFELNFDKAPVGEIDVNNGDNKYYSILGGKIGSKASFDNFFINNGSGANYPAMDTEIVERAEGDNYISFTTNSTGAKNLIQITPTASAMFVAEDGYLVATADVLWGTSAASKPLDFVYNTKQAAENGDQDEVYNVTQNGGWGTVVSYYDAEIGLAGSGGNATAIEDITVINFLKIHGDGAVATGETFGLDNIRLFWTPKTAKLTIKVDGQDDVVIENYPTTGMAAADIAAMLPEVENKKLVGFSLNPDGELLENTRIARDTVVYPVYEERIVLDGSLEFNSSSDLSKLSFRTGKNNALGAGFASIVDDSYMRLTFTATDTTQVVQDTGFNYTLPATIPAGGFLEMEMRVRFTGMPTVTTTLNQAGGGTTSFNPAGFAWPEMYYNNAAVHDADNTISISGKDGEWFTIVYTPAEMKIANVDLTQFRFDFFNYMPHGSTLDVDYIRFIAEPEEEPEVPVCDICGGEHETADCPNVEPEQPEIDAEWLGEYGELVFEVNFEKLPVGAAGTAFSYDMQNYGASIGNFLSNFGGKVNPAYSISESEIYVRNESGKANIVIKEDAEHGKYVEYTITSDGASKNVWDFTPYTSGKKFADKDGYFILTVDYKQPKDGHVIQTHWNRSHNAEDMVKVAAKETYPAANTWGEYRSIYDADSIGKSTHNPPIASVTEIDHVLLYNSSQAAGETYAFDNVRLWWVPKTVNITVPAGSNTSVSDQVFTIVPTETTAGNLAGMVYGGTKGVVGFSLTEGGEMLPADKLLAFAYDTTLYPVWEDVNILDTSLEFNSSSDISRISFRTGSNNSLGSGFASIVDNSYMRVTFTGTDTTKVVQDTGFNYTLPTAIAAGELDRIEMRVRFTGMPADDTSLNQATGGTAHYDPDNVAWPEMYYNNAAIHDANNSISLSGKDGEWFIVSYSAQEAGLASAELSQFRYDFFNYMPSGTTLDIDYIRFIGAPLYQLTIDMGDNTTATPVSMSYGPSTTVANVLAKIIDHGDKKFLGLSRTPGGEILASNEKVGDGSGDVTLYAVWEDYEYLDKYNVEFNDEDTIKFHISQNNAQSSYELKDGVLTLKAVPKDGYTATWDHQVYVDTVNAATAIPAGVVDYIAVRMRYRNVPAASASYTVESRGTNTFNPADNPAYVHIARYGTTAWGSNLQSNDRREKNIVDGQWFVRLLDADTYFKDGLAYVRFDSPYPMPAGMEMDIDYVRFIGDETKLPEVEYESQYGEMVWSLNFDKATTGVQTLNYKPIWELGADLNLSFNAAYDYANLKMTNGGSPTTEIIANSNGSGNYLKVTATKDGTGNFLYVHGSKNFSDKDGYYIITYDVINGTGASVPHTFRLNYLDRVEDAVDNIQVIENGEWDKAVVYYDSQIGTGTNSSGYVISDITDITNVKFHNASTTKVGETICIDNLTLWYVPKTVPVIIDNSAVGMEETLIEEYPTCGMTSEELAAILPEISNGKFVGLSATEGGALLYENRSAVPQILYSNWSIDTVLTVDMGDNKKLSNMTIQIPAGSSVKVSDIEAKFIDHGDKMFAGLSNTVGGEKLSSTATISATDSGAVTIYALWNEYYTNDFYSVEFDHKGEGVVKGLGESYLSAGKNSAYWSGSKDASGTATPGDADDALEWNEDGYITMNFVASPYAKAQADENGYTALVWDPFMEIDSLYDAADDVTYLPAGDADYVVVRMRYRGMPSKNTAYWRADTSEAYTLKPNSVFAPFYYYTTTAGANFGSPSISKTVSVAEGSAYRDNWFTVFIPASELEITDKNVYRFRIDPNDGMPDGSAIDIDFIRFVVTDKQNEYDAPNSRKDRVSARIKADDADRNGVRVLAELLAAQTKVKSADIGWMFTSSARWNSSSGSTERSWYELKMDLYDENSSFIKVGFTKKNDEMQVRGFYEELDDYAAFTAVLYNIPIKNYKSPFIVRPFAKYNGSYAYGEPFEINFLDVLQRVAEAEGATPEAVAYYNDCSAEYAAHLNANASYNSSEVVAALNTVMSSASSIKSNLIIPTNDTVPTVSGNIVTMKAWKDGSIVTLNVSTKDTYPAIIDTSTGLLSDAYAEKPCVYYLSDGVYYIKSLGRSTNASGDYNGVEKSDASAMEANVDGSALFLSEITDGNVASPFQRLPIDDELTNGQNSFFLGDFATGKFDFTFSRANSATRTIETGKTGIIGSDSKVVAKYNFANGTTEWVSYAQAQLLKMGLDSDSNNIKDGIDFTNLTYVVSNNTTNAGENQREYEDLAVLAGEVDVPAHTTTLTNFNSAEYNKVIVKTTSSASYVTVKFTRADGVSNSIKYYAYGTTPDGYRVFDVDLDGIAKYHGTISSLTVRANASNTSYVQYAYLIKNPNYYTTADLASMTRTEIFADTSFDNGFYVRDMDQKMKKDEWQNYKFANNGNTPVWMIDPWYSYDYSDSANKASYELYNIASPTATSLADSQGTKVVKFNGTKTSTQADGKSYTGDVLSLTLNGRAIYDGKKHSEMQSAGMTYWPHLLIEQNREVNTVDVERNSAGADKIFLEMDIKMTNYEAKVDSMLSSAGTKQLQFLLYTYLRPKANDGDRIWFGASLCSEGTVDYPTWNRDTGASSYIYCIPQEVVYQGIANSFYQHIQDNTDDETLFGGGTTKTSKDWVHVSLDVTPYIQTAIDWANREDAFGLGALTRDDFYFDGVNIGFETHGNIDGTFEIANFNFVAYND